MGVGASHLLIELRPLLLFSGSLHTAQEKRHKKETALVVDHVCSFASPAITSFLDPYKNPHAATL